MKTNAEKSLELIIQLEKHNENYRNMTSLIASNLAACIGEKCDDDGWVLHRDKDEPCLNDWLRRDEVESDSGYGNRWYWKAEEATDEDCPYCYKALKIIEQRKELKLKRGRVKAQITKLAKREILKGNF
jgi:hypothetical protein